MCRTDICDYYVTLVRHKRVAFLAGPFGTHTEALTMVRQAKDEAYEVDRWSWFDACGTSSLPHDAGNPIGKLNDRLGVDSVHSITRNGSLKPPSIASDLPSTAAELKGD